MAKPRAPKAAAACSSMCRGAIHCGTMQPPPTANKQHNQSTASAKGCAALLLSITLSLLVSDSTATTTAPLTASASSASSRHLLQTTGSQTPAPPPPCAGQCCSARPPRPRGTPLVSTEWLSAQMANGARIQIRNPAFNCWWRVTPNPLYANTVQCDTTTKPDQSIFFTVLRTNNNMIQLIAPNGRYVRAASAAEYPSFDPANVKCDLTADASDPKTVWRVEPYSVTTSVVFFRSNADGGVVSWTDGFLMRKYFNREIYNPSIFEWEQMEIRELTHVPAPRGTSLGSWIMYEPWINPLLAQRAPWFSVDGTKFALQSNFSGLWVSATNASLVGGPISVNISADAPPDVARFSMWFSPRNASNFVVRTQYMHYWELQSNGSVIATNVIMDESSEGTSNMDFTFIFQNQTNDVWFTRVLILAPNGMFLRAPAKGSANMGLMADVPASSVDITSSSRMFASGPAVFLFAREMTAATQPGGTACWCLPWSYWCIDS